MDMDRTNILTYELPCEEARVTRDKRNSTTLFPKLFNEYNADSKN